MKDDSSYIRHSAVEALGKIGDARAVEPLFAAAEPSSMRRRYTVALVNIGAPTAEALIPLLKGRFSNVYAWNIVKEIGLPAVEPLIVALVIEDSGVRDSAEDLLWEMGTPAVEPLLAALDNKSFLIQLRIIEVLNIIAARGDMPTSEAEEAAEPFFAPFRLLDAGHGVKEMADYGGSAPHPIVVLDSSDSSILQSMYELPSEWVPASIDDIQLVAFVGNERVEIEILNYTMGYLYREQWRREVRLIEALTGRVVADKIFLGSLPRKARNVETFSSNISRHTLTGNEVPFAEIQRWLSSYVEG